VKTSAARYLPAICIISLLVRLQAIAAHDPPVVGASDPDFILVENVTSAEQAVLNEVEAEVRRDRPKAPDVVTKALRTKVPAPVPFSCEIVRAAIFGFDEQANRVEVARLIFAAVKARPEEVLSIVGVAIENLPGRLHRDIVGAAVAAVPDPYACISPTSLHWPPCSRRPEQAGYRTASDQDRQLNSIIYEPETPGPCTGITLAEAILQQALLSGTIQSEMALSTTINEVLRNVGSPDPLRASNFEWDTLISKDPGALGTPPPTPPPVSP
jgi:hypothetical protein